jgi:hypothetical protein
VFAILAAGAFSADVNAEKPSHAGPRSSIGVTSVCSLDQLPDGGGPALRVDTTIINKTSGDEIPMITSATITPLQKVKKKTLPLGVEEDLGIGMPEDFPVTNSVLIDICAQDPPLMATATSLNALVAVTIVEGSKEEYTSMCSDDPTTDETIEGGVKIGHLALCQ